MKLTPRQAAERAGVSAQMIYQWCGERRLAHYRAGGTGRRGRILIDETDLEAFLRTLRVEAGAVIVDGAGTPPLRLKHLNL